MIALLARYSRPRCFSFSEIGCLKSGGCQTQERIGKLVRDRIPQIIERSGKSCEVIVYKGTDYQRALQRKLNEEVDEFNKATTEENWMEELADIHEVVLGLLRSKGYSFNDLEKTRIEKKMQKGGFEQGLFLVRTFLKK